MTTTAPTMTTTLTTNSTMLTRSIPAGFLTGGPPGVEGDDGDGGDVGAAMATSVTQTAGDGSPGPASRGATRLGQVDRVDGQALRPRRQRLLRAHQGTVATEAHLEVQVGTTGP